MTAFKREGIRERDATFCNLIILICFVFLFFCCQPRIRAKKGSVHPKMRPKISFQFKSAKFEVLKTGPTLD